MERYKGSLEPWSCCTGGGCVLCDDERSCWEVAIFQVPTLLRDGGCCGLMTTQLEVGVDLLSA